MTAFGFPRAMERDAWMRFRVLARIDEKEEVEGGMDEGGRWYSNEAGGSASIHSMKDGLGESRGPFEGVSLGEEICPGTITEKGKLPGRKGVFGSRVPGWEWDVPSRDIHVFGKK
jgi:hypothetical protein